MHSISVQNWISFIYGWVGEWVGGGGGAKQQILFKCNRRMETDENVALFGASKTETETAEITNKVNDIMLIA